MQKMKHHLLCKKYRFFEDVIISFFYIKKNWILRLNDSSTKYMNEMIILNSIWMYSLTCWPGEHQANHINFSVSCAEFLELGD